MRENDGNHVLVRPRLSTVVVALAAISLCVVVTFVALYLLSPSAQASSSAAPAPSLPPLSQPSSTNSGAYRERQLLQEKNPQPSRDIIDRHLRQVVVVGAGMAAASFVHNLPRAYRDVTIIYEASSRAGGRALSSPTQTTPISTAATPREFAANVYHPFIHLHTHRFLQQLGCQTMQVALRVPQSFYWSETTGTVPIPTHTPTCTTAITPRTTSSATTVVKRVPLKDCMPEDYAWLAVTGIPAKEAPNADATLLRNITLKNYGVAVSGFGWQDAAMRGIGELPVMYNHTLRQVIIRRDKPTCKAILQFSNGFSTIVRLGSKNGSGNARSTTTGAIVLTLPPADLVNVQGIPSAVKTLISDCFTTIAGGVLFATWATADVWWMKLGFPQGVFATDTPLGRAFVLPTGNDMRFQMVGQSHLDYWSNLIFNQNAPQGAKFAMSAEEAVAYYLRKIFQSDDIAVPVAVTFKAWPRAVALWNVGVDRTNALKTLQRPFGDDVAVYWASADISDSPGWVEGAVQSGYDAARAVNALQ